MPQTVKCPRCGKELIAPDELIGKVAACPQCHEPIPITGSIRGSTPPSTTNSPTMATVATNLPPTAAPTAAVLPPPPDVRRSNPILATMPVTAPPEPRSAQPVAVDLILHNGKVWTGDPKTPEAAAVAAWGGRGNLDEEVVEDVEAAFAACSGSIVSMRSSVLSHSLAMTHTGRTSTPCFCASFTKLAGE